MKKNYKLFKFFLLSKNSNFISYSISKLHNTYADFFSEQKTNSTLSRFKKLLYLFDGPNIYQLKLKRRFINSFKYYF